MQRWPIVFALSCLPALAAAQGAPVPIVMAPPPQIVVSGSGEAHIVPDRASIDVSVQTRDASVTKATSDNARRLRAVMDTLRALGLASTQITTTDYSVYPEQQYDAEGRNPRVVAYTVTNTIHVLLSKIEMAGAVIDASLAKGANVIGALQFSSSRADEARRAALADATQSARLDAQAMATAAGGTLGDLLELSTEVATIPRPFMVAMQAKAADGGTPVSEGTQTVSVSVTGRWKFVQK